MFLVKRPLKLIRIVSVLSLSFFLPGTYDWVSDFNIHEVSCISKKSKKKKKSQE